ncbi:two-component system response regulator [Methyloceanibacter methanicus]|uniref:Two-component system response regulator n=1 Tax=Methyloceanibacter methanicus TaxID=1774968 RepID=A0A1E3VXG4_9HYPH|nr:response regulator FixJ [Methyloceanibacter methanicus]ODR97961.1 two-component system response regulator [Methyloceanibacter methanicus]
MPVNPVVHIVDDDEAVRQSLAFMLGSAGFPVRLYESAQLFLEAVDPMQCGCLITDVRMPDMTGIELLGRIKDKIPFLPAIVITGHGDIPLAVEAMKAGAVDFIEKPFDEEVLLKAVEAALERATGEGADQMQEVLSRLASLSERERQVLEGLVAGQANKVIAAAYGISPRTVEVYRANVMSKMQANSLPDLVRMALLAHIGPPAGASE